MAAVGYAERERIRQEQGEGPWIGAAGTKRATVIQCLSTVLSWCNFNIQLPIIPSW